MADFNAIQAGTLTPEDYAAQQAINRQQQMAAMLMQQNQQPQGQMISGRYVAPSWAQQLQPVANMLAGAYLASKGDTEAAKLAQRIRETKGAKEEAITNLITGTPEVKTELAGPYAGNVPQPVAVKEATKPDLAAALREISTNNPYNAGAEYKAAIVGNMIPKIPDAVAKYKFAQTPEGGNFKGSLADFENQMNEYQRRSLALQAANQNKPQIIETANGYVAVNPNNPAQATPVMFNGQPVMGNKGNLPEGAAGQVTGVQNVKSALKDLKTNLKDFSTFDMANPNARALMATDYENVVLQLKEAMKLGVLNGNDYKILTSMVTDPTSPAALLMTKDTQTKQIQKLEDKLDEMTKNVYKTHGRTVPNNLQMGTENPANPAAPAMPKIDPALLQYMTPEQQALFSPPKK